MTQKSDIFHSSADGADYVRVTEDGLELPRSAVESLGVVRRLQHSEMVVLHGVAAQPKDLGSVRSRRPYLVISPFPVNSLPFVFVCYLKLLDEPGSLVSALRILQERRVNVSALSCGPSAPGEVLCYAACEHVALRESFAQQLASASTANRRKNISQRVSLSLLEELAAIEGELKQANEKVRFLSFCSDPSTSSAKEIRKLGGAVPSGVETSFMPIEWDPAPFLLATWQAHVSGFAIDFAYEPTDRLLRPLDRDLYERVLAKHNYRFGSLLSCGAYPQAAHLRIGVADARPLLEAACEEFFAVDKRKAPLFAVSDRSESDLVVVTFEDQQTLLRALRACRVSPEIPRELLEGTSIAIPREYLDTLANRVGTAFATEDVISASLVPSKELAKLRRQAL